MSFYSLNEGLSTIRQHAEHIVDASSGLIGVSAAVCMKNANAILQMLDAIQPTPEEEVLCGQVGGRLADDDGVGGSREDLRELRNKAEAGERELRRTLRARTVERPQRARRRKKAKVRGRGRAS